MATIRDGFGSTSRFILLSCLLLLSNWQNSCEANPFLALSSIIKYSEIAFKIVSTTVKGRDLLQTDEKFSEGESEIENHISELSTDFREMGAAILDKISETLHSKLSVKTDKIFKYMKNIHRLYEEFLSMFHNWHKVPTTLLVQFAKSVTSSSLVEIKSTIQKMHEIFVDLDLTKESVVTIIAKKSSAADTVCKRLQTSQQLIYELYDMVSKTHVKGLMVILFGYEILEKHNEQNYDWVQQKELDEYLDRIEETHSKVKHAMSIASRELWKCDPPEHIIDKTYSKLEEVFQAYFLYQPDTYRIGLRAYVDGCSDLKNEVLKCVSPHCLDQPTERLCRGALRDCTFISRTMTYCHAPYGSSRRYEWMETGYGMVYGHKVDSCKKIQSVSNILPIDTCICNCESEKREKVRYFSLTHTTSNIKANRVVTGARIVKKGLVFYLEIQEGLLGPNGTIKDTPKWKETQELSNLTLLSDTVSVAHHDNMRSFWDDFHDIYEYNDWTDWRENPYVYAVNYHQNTVHLSDLEAPLQKLVTGLRFKRIGNDLTIEIQVTGFDYDTGRLNNSLTSWLASSDSNKSELSLKEPDEPIRAPTSDEVSKPNTYVKFRMSDLKKDLGQSTVPYIDLQAIETNPPQPVAGVGLFHRGKKYYGGFLSLKLIQYDFSPYM